MRYQLLTCLLILVGCDGSVAPNAAVAPPTTAPSTKPTTGDVPASAAALGLGATTTPEQMITLERRVKEIATLSGQSCGVTTLDGTTYGFYINHYRVKESGHAALRGLSFGHIQHAAHPIVSVYGQHFRYELRDGTFVLIGDEAGP